MNTNKPVSREPSSTSQPLRKAALALPLIAMAGAFAAPASMSRSASHSSSRRLARGATIVVADQALQIDAAASEQDEMPRSAFDAFRRGQTSGRALDNTGATLSENTLSDDAGILAFLQQNQRLESQPKAAAALSGALLGRKYFASDSPFDHCHFTWGSVYYTNTYTSLNQASCEISWSGTWHTGVSAPVVMATSILNKTSSSFDVSVSMSESATVYAVLVESNKTAPTPAQVIAGTDGDNNAALQTTSGAAANSTTLSFSGLDASKYYLVYLAAVDGSSEVTSASTQVNPAYETGLISADGTWKFPKIRVDDSGNYYLGYSKDGSSGDDITFLLWNGAGFSNYTSFNASAISGRAYVSWGNEQRVDYDFDSNGHIHAVFSATETNYANTGDPFYGYYNGSSWSFTKIAETGNSVDEVDVFVDANDDVHVSWKVYNGSGYQVDYATNKSGSWVKTNVVVAGNGTDEAHDTYVVADSSGTATVFYRREDSQNNGEDNYYMESSSDGFSASTKILNGKGDAKVYRMANVLIDSSNKIHYAYSDQTGGASYYVTNASGGWVSTAITHAGHSTPWVYGMEYDNGVYYFANYGDSKYFINSYNGSDWVDGFDFELDGWMNDRFAVNSTADRIMLVSENSSDWEIHYHTGTIAGYVTPTSPADSDGNLTSAAGVTEPVGLDTTVDSVGEAVDLFDFTLSDGASSDGLAMEISQLVVNVSGTSSDAERANVTWRLNGADASNVTGVYSSANDTITFSGLSISIADGGSEIYTINGYYNDNTGLTEDHTMILSMDGDTDVTISGGTSMGATSAVSNSSGTTVDVTATGLRLTTQAAGLVSGMAMTTQPVVAAEDAFGNIDSDFTEVVTGSDEGISPGNVLTNNSVTAVAGVATFTSLTNTTATDGQALIVTFNDQDGIGSNLTTVNTNLLFTDVVATQLQLTTQPAPLTVSSGEAKSLTTVPVVKAVDANGYVDTGYSSDIRLAEVNGAGSALMTTTGDTDGSAATVSLTPSSGVATFTALQITYTTSGSSSETFNLQASSGSLTTTTSSQLTATNVPTLTDAHISISGASGTGGTYVIGDTISASWNNTSSGDNNTGVSAVTVDFSPFGGGAAISASESAGSWIATYTLTAGAIDSSNRNVLVTATNSSGHATAADTTNASVDNIAPIVTDANLSISGASGIGGAFRAGDTVTARWNNTAGGDNNSDTISSASVNFSAFGGGAAVVASNSAGSWSATYTLVSSAIDSSNRNISLTAIDNAGNSTTSADSTNATVDNMAPTITDGHLSISGASGSGGVFIAGDTLTARWNNTAAGDNNSDTISSVTMNFVAFGGGSAVVASNNSGIWSASYSITSSSTDGTLLNISATATDNAGNNASATDSSNATVDTSAPSGHSVAFDDSLIGSGEYNAVSFTFASAEVAGNYSYSISSSGGGTAVTGSGTVSSAAEQVSGIDLSGLNDGTLTLSVILTDVAGNSATAVTDTSTLDTTAPVLTEVSAATSLGNDTTPALTFSTNEAGTLAVGGSCGSASEGAVSSGNQTISLSQPDNSSALAEGSYNDCTLTVTDAADNASSALSLSGFEIDLTGPSGHSISFDDSLINSTEASSISVTMASAEVGAAYRYSISSSGGGTAVTGSGTVTSASEPLTAIDVSSLTDGTLTVSLFLTDSADNAASAVTATSTLDTSAPSGHSVAFDDSLIGSGEYNAVSFTFASAEVAGSYSYSISSSGGGTAVTGSGTVSSAAEQVSGIDLSGLNDGTLTLSVILTDVAGNSATAVTDTSTLDVAVPTGHSVSLNDTVYNATEVGSVSFSFANAETGTDYEYSYTLNGITLDGLTGTVSTAAEQSSSTNLASFGDGTLTLSVILTDSAGNPATAVTDTATVDTTVPSGHSISFDDSLINSTEASSISVTMASAEVGAAYRYSISSSGGGTAVTGSGTVTSASEPLTAIDVSGLADGTLTVSLFLTDSADNAASAVTATSTLDTSAPSGHSVAFDDSLIGSGEYSAVSFTFASAEVAGSYSYSISSSGGGTAVTGSGTVSSAAEQVSGIDLSGLNDGTLTLSVILTDVAGNSATAVTDTSTLDVADPVLSSSTPADDASSVQYNSRIVLTLSEAVSATTGNFQLYDADGDTLVEAIAVGSGQVVISGTQVTITPAANWTPTHRYYLLADSGLLVDAALNGWAGLSVASELNFTVANNNPTGGADSGSTQEDTAVDINVLANDGDVDSTLNAASVTVTHAPAHGSASVNTANGVITYTPLADFNGVDSFTYAVDDIYSGSSGDITVSIAVAAVNDAPVAVADVATTAEDTAVTINVANNDTDVDNSDSVDTTTLTIVSAAAEGSASVVSGQIEYTPAANFNGSDSLTYQIKDQHGATSNVATLIINVSGVNDAPVAAADTGSTAEDTELVIDVIGNDTDIDGTLDSSKVTVVSSPAHGTITVDASSGEITYRPAADFNGSDSFTYVVKDDSDATSNIATVSLTITAVNDAPVASNDNVTLLEDASLNINALGNDSDVDGSIQAATLVLVEPPAQGIASVLSGVINYTPDADFNGADSLSYRVQDDSGAWSNTATVVMTITAVNDEPLANNDSASTSEDSAVVIDVAANDSDIDGSLDLNSIVVVTDVSHGTLVDNADGSLTYTPDSDYYGSDSFTYQLSDNEAGTSAVASVSLSVAAVNDAPLLSGTPASSVLEGSTFSFTPTVVDSDSSSFNFTLSGAPAWLVINSTTGKLTGTPAVGDEGSYSGIVMTADDRGTVNPTGSLPAFSLVVIGDNDSDGIANADDSDDDNDGMPDDYETRYGFDPFDDSDALTDSDGDTIPNGQEQQDGTDPSNSSDYLDTTPPMITPPADAIVDATGVFTRVSVADLLGVSDTSAALAAMTSDNVDGPGCCNTSVLGLKGGSLRMRPGIHTVTYSATDAKGNTSTTTQTLRVRPLVSFSRDIASVEGGNVEVDVVLNGSAPDYPFEVPYRIDSASSTADSADHNLSAGSVIFTADSTEARISFQLTDDGISEGAEILVLALDDDTTESDDLSGGYDPSAPDIHDINAGASHRVTITIGEQNLAPAASMVLQQGGSNTVLVARDGGMVTATVRVTDANLQDTHRFDWASSHSALVDTDGSLTNTTLVFDPSGLSSGRYNVQVRVDDSQGAADIARIYFRVEASAPVLSGSDDSDGDGIVDADEGTADSDDDGIPDYLDNIAQSNLLPETASETDGFLVECDPGVLCRLGQFAIMGSSGGARLSDDDIAAQQDLGADDDFEPKGGVFDFEIHDLPTMGQSVSIVVPQTQQIPANAVYRKFQNGRWNSFVSDTNNHIYSSAGSLGYCPPPGDSSWVAGLTEGDFCVQLTIEDGGPNDADNEVNGAVEDPGAVSILRADQTQTLADISTRADRSGGSLGGLGLLLLAAVASCGYRRRPGTHRSALPAVILPLAGVLGLALLMPTATVEAATPASEYDSYWLEDLGLDQDKGYVTIGLYRAHSSQSGGELQSQLQTDGLDATVTDYDAKRTTFDMGIGYRYLPGYAVEIRYLDMGAASTDLSANAAPNDLKTSLRRHHPVGGSGIVLSQRFSDAINNQLTLSFELGLYRWSGEVDTRRDDLNSHLDSGTAPMGGLGLDYQLNTEVGIGIRYQRFLFDRQQLDLAGASVQIGF